MSLETDKGCFNVWKKLSQLFSGLTQGKDDKTQDEAKASTFREVEKTVLEPAPQESRRLWDLNYDSPHEEIDILVVAMREDIKYSIWKINNNFALFLEVSKNVLL